MEKYDQKLFFHPISMNKYIFEKISNFFLSNFQLLTPFPPQKEPTIRFFEHTFQTILRRKKKNKGIFFRKSWKNMTKIVFFVRFQWKFFLWINVRKIFKIFLSIFFFYGKGSFNPSHPVLVLHPWTLHDFGLRTLVGTGSR